MRGRTVFSVTTALPPAARTFCTHYTLFSSMEILLSIDDHWQRDRPPRLSPGLFYLGRHAGSILSEVGWSLLRSDREYEVQSGEFQQLAYATRGIRHLQFKAGRVS